jgi:hypothetical protein
MFAGFDIDDDTRLEIAERMSAPVATRRRQERNARPTSSANHRVFVPIHRSIAHDALARQKQVGGGDCGGSELAEYRGGLHSISALN